MRLSYGRGFVLGILIALLVPLISTARDVPHVGDMHAVQPGSVLGAAVACPNLYRDLSYGMSGEDVKELQNFLIEIGDLAAGNNTGYFGPLTRAAVRTFQCREMQICSGSEWTNGYGRVGPKTRDAIASVCGSTSYSQANYYSQASYYAQGSYNTYSQAAYYSQGSYSPTTTLSAPTGLTASCAPAGTSVTLSWNPVQGAANYGLRLTQEGSGVFSEIKDWYPQTSYTTSAFTSGLSWGWWVHANPAMGTLGPNSNPPNTFTCYKPNPEQTLLVDSFDAYSAEPIYINGELKMYFGGWMTQADLPHDSIFIADCNIAGTSCSNIRKVLDPVAHGWNQINDPSIILHPALPGGQPYYIMYMTCNRPNNIPGHDGVCYSTSYDGLTWGAPALLMENHWLPTAIWKNDHVELWTNYNGGNQELRMYNLGPSGVAVGTPTNLVWDNAASNNNVNVNVVWRPTLNAYQMLAERAVRGNSSVIDYLDSTDGVHWYLRAPAVIQPVPGSRVGTPAQHPDTAFRTFFGQTTDLQYSMEFKIYSAQWSFN